MKLFLGFYYKIISNKNFLHKNSWVSLILLKMQQKWKRAAILVAFFKGAQKKGKFYKF